MDTFISLYFDGKDKKFISGRERACEAVLEGEELENFEKTMQEIKKFLERNKKMAIFASHKYDYFKVIELPKIKNMLVVDSSPYIRPLVESIESYKSFFLLLLNYNHAKIFSISANRLKEEKKLSAHIMNKHKKGGWSQPRFQRLRKESIHAFFVKVLEELKKFHGEIIIGGPGQAKHDFMAILPKSLQKKIVGMIDVDIDDIKDLLEESMDIIAEENRKGKEKLLEHLKGEILKDGLATYGINSTIEAAKNGQIEILFVEKGYKLRGWICEKCQVVEAGIKNECPYCHGKTSEVDVIEEIIEFAERTDALVNFIEEMKKFGHVAALLRYK